MTKLTVVLINRLGALLVWALASYLIIFHGFWYLFVGIIFLHTVELFWKGYKRGIRAGYSRMYSIAMTLFWGYTWWYYLREDSDCLPDRDSAI